MASRGPDKSFVLSAGQWQTALHATNIDFCLLNIAASVATHTTWHMHKASTGFLTAVKSAAHLQSRDVLQQPSHVLGI